MAVVVLVSPRHVRYLRRRRYVLHADYCKVCSAICDYTGQDSSLYPSCGWRRRT